MDNLLAFWENQNKDKHGKNFQYQRKNDPPFVLYVNGMLGKEALVVIVDLSQLTAEKWISCDSIKCRIFCYLSTYSTWSMMSL